VESSLGFSFLCPYLGKHQPTLVETLTSTLLKLSDVFDKLPNVDMCFKVLSTQHPYDANKQTDKMTILALKKKNVRVVGMGVCLPLRVTAVTIPDFLLKCLQGYLGKLGCQLS
jgi:hypothetical protein